eukprot:3227363-Heterocapsa_arctica.AAC.1
MAILAATTAFFTSRLQPGNAEQQNSQRAMLKPEKRRKATAKREKADKEKTRREAQAWSPRLKAPKPGLYKRSKLTQTHRRHKLTSRTILKADCSLDRLPE